MNQELLKVLFRWSVENRLPESISSIDDDSDMGTEFIWRFFVNRRELRVYFYRGDRVEAATTTKVGEWITHEISTERKMLDLLNWVNE